MQQRRALLAELRSYIGFSNEDAGLLARFLPIAEPHLRGVADEFYAIIRMHEGAFAVLKDEAQARRLHSSLQTWLRELLAGPYDEAWVERHARLGEVHVRVGLPLRFMITAMSRVRVSLQRIAAAGLPESDSGTRLAIARICDLDLAIMLEAYHAGTVGRVEGARKREQVAMRSQLDERNRLLHDVLEAAEVVLLGFDASGKLVVANAKLEQLTGCSRDELARAGLFEPLFGEHAAQVRAQWLSASEGSPVEVEREARTRSGKTRIVRWHVSVHPTSEQPEAPMFVVVGIDVTHQRELERRARQNERLAAAGALAAGLAHEVRNPLNGASLHASLLDRALARAPDVPPAAREAADVLRTELRRLSALVSDFLEVARPKPLVRVDCDLNELARSVQMLLAPEAEARRVSMELEPFPFPVRAHVDVERTKQVLVNLVRNALEAVSDGGHVSVRVRRLPHDVEVDVVDDGPGVEDASAPIFDAFYTTKDRGTGLGLSIVQRIVTDHGGDVSFRRDPGATTFTIRLPTDAAQSVL